MLMIVSKYVCVHACFGNLDSEDERQSEGHLVADFHVETVLGLKELRKLPTCSGRYFGRAMIHCSSGTRWIAWLCPLT